MRIKEQFDKKAKTYNRYSAIQQKGVELLVSKMPKSLGTVLDLGCGSGRVFKELKKQNVCFNNFFGVDFSKEMLKAHPKGANLIIGDFNDETLFKNLAKLKADTLISASALQWAKNIEKTLYYCSLIAPMGYFFIFTSGTFKSLHKTLKINSPISPKNVVKEAFLKNYKAFEIREYNFVLNFESSKEMLNYIKKSGVSGGKRDLKVATLKKIISQNSIKHLEFETLLLIGKSINNLL